MPKVLNWDYWFGSKAAEGEEPFLSAADRRAMKAVVDQIEMEKFQKHMEDNPVYEPPEVDLSADARAAGQGRPAASLGYQPKSAEYATDPALTRGARGMGGGGHVSFHPGQRVLGLPARARLEDDARGFAGPHGDAPEPRWPEACHRGVGGTGRPMEV